MTSTQIPTAIDTDAPVVSRRWLIIPVARATVWAIHLDVERWPEWQNDISAASIDGPFATGRTITWQTAGIETPIPSTIYAVEPGHRTLWGGPAMGIVGIHEWRFSDAEGSTLVETEESWAGSPVEADPAAMLRQLDTSLDSWLERLRVRASSV